METELVKLTVRLPRPAFNALRKGAFDRHVPPGVLARMMLCGTIPPSAPPVLSPAGRELAAVLSRLASNLTQLHSHASAAPDPLCRVARQGGELEQMQATRDALAERLETGDLDDPAAWLEKLHSPAHQINGLASALNHNKPQANAVWGTALVALRDALAGVSAEAARG